MEILLPEAKRRKVGSQMISVSSTVEYDVGREDDGDKGVGARKRGHEDSTDDVPATVSGRSKTGASQTVLHVVTPGEVIAKNDAGFMRYSTRH